jgi:hypothetical protein
MAKRMALKFAPLAMIGALCWLVPACGGDEDDNGASSGGSGGSGGSSGGTGGTGSGGDMGDSGETGTDQGGTGATGSGGTGEAGAASGGADAGGAAGAAGAPAEPPECLGDPLPETIDAEITISGLVTGWGGGGLEDATVEARDASDEGLLLSDTSDVTGAYALALDTGEAPLDAFLRVSAINRLDSYIYPPVPFIASVLDADLPLITSGLRTTAANAAEVTLEADTGLLYVLVIGCDGAPIPGATVTTDPPGELRYTEGGLPSVTATATDDTGGALIFNVPPGDVELDASINGFSLREHTFEVRADVMTISAIVP